MRGPTYIRRRAFWISLCSLCLCGSISFAAHPRDEILRLIPDDAGLCLLVQDLRGQIDRLKASPFAARLAASPMGRAFRDVPEAGQLAAFNEQLTKHLKITWPELRDDILGDAVAFAYTPGPPDKPDQEQGLILLHARRPERLVALFDRLNELQKKSGELQSVETRDDGGVRYSIRRKAEGNEYYAIAGSILAFQIPIPAF